VEAVCNASLPVESCLERLPADARTRLLLVGDFLSAKGELNDVEADCVAKVAPVLLKDSSASSDGSETTPTGDELRQVPLTQSIGYGALFVTIISFCSLGGAVIMPFIETNCYKKCLMWMVGLAVGTLSGSGLLHLMPHAFGMKPEEIGLGYLHRASTIFGGIYLFFITERVLRSVESWRRKRRDSQRRKRHLSRLSSTGAEGEAPEDRGRVSPDVQFTPICSMHAHRIQTDDERAELKVPPRTPKHSESHEVLKSPDDQNSAVAKLNEVIIRQNNGEVSADPPHHGHAHHGHSHEVSASTGGSSDIATVAWMVIFGDGLHNFIDGLSIGAAFTESILSGISISVAVICEEFPHELGDFAILLNSGMKFRQALMYNFMSACMCYCGLIFGIILGDTTESGQWIFALAAGMFLYISLVNMVPELNQQAEDMKKGGTPLWLVLVIQHSGIIVGFVIMYLMAAYGGEIDFS